MDLASLIDSALIEGGVAADRIQALDNPIWKPQPGPQTIALSHPADEIFFGGQAGGGKTDLAIGTGLTEQHSTIIFRREYKQLRAIIRRMIEIVGHKKGLNQQSGLWDNLPGGRSVEFGAMQLEDDKFNFKGRPHDCYVFDEAPDFSETQIDFVTGWLRTTIRGQRTRVILTGNPPTTAEGEWIIRRYAAWLDKDRPNPAKPGELRWYVMVDGIEIERPDGTPFDHNGMTIYPRSRTFIPAKLSDNAYLSSDPNYVSVLQSLPEPLRSQLLFGDFSIKANDDEWQVIPTAWVIAAQKRWDQRERPQVALRAIGADVARGGNDYSAFAPLYGTYFESVLKFPGSQTPDGDSFADKLIDVLAGQRAMAYIDVVGIGASAYDATIRRGLPATGVNFGAGATTYDKSGKFMFSNVRSESYWKLREALDPASGEEIALPPDREVLADLCAARYEISGGRIKVEPKDDIKARLGRSPDVGDAIVLAWRCTIQSEAAIYVGTRRVR